MPFQVDGPEWGEHFGKKAFEIYTKLTFGADCDTDSRWDTLTPSERWTWLQVANIVIHCHTYNGGDIPPYTAKTFTETI